MAKKKYKKNISKNIFPIKAKGNKRNKKIEIKENNKLKRKVVNKNIIFNSLENKNKKKIKNSEISKSIHEKKDQKKNEGNNSELNDSYINSSNDTVKDYFSLNSLDLNDSKLELSFLKDNEKNWLNYFDLLEKKDIPKWNRLNKYAAEILTKDEKEADILVNLILKIDEVREKSKYGEIKEKFTFYEIPIYDIWNIKDFNNYSEECWKKYKFVSTYKVRYTAKYKKLLFKSWENILCYMGFNFIMEGENIWNYIWYLWFLPKKLLILWYARINISEKNDCWWIALLKEWFNYFMEILRVGNIKKWIIDFIGKKEGDSPKKNKIKQLNIESGVQECDEDDSENNNDHLKKKFQK